MAERRSGSPCALALLVVVGLGAIAALTLAQRPRVGNRRPPQPLRDVDLERYLGVWYELFRYENRFERGCDHVTAEYGLRRDGLVSVTNRCRTASGQQRVARGRARVMAGSGDAKLKVSFFGPFYLGDYWVLDRADDYAWAIVGEPSGRYLWILSREPRPAPQVRAALQIRAQELGYDITRLRATAQ